VGPRWPNLTLCSLVNFSKKVFRSPFLYMTRFYRHKTDFSHRKSWTQKVGRVFAHPPQKGPEFWSKMGAPSFFPPYFLWFSRFSWKCTRARDFCALFRVPCLQVKHEKTPFSLAFFFRICSKSLRFFTMWTNRPSNALRTLQFSVFTISEDIPQRLL